MNKKRVELCLTLFFIVLVDLVEAADWITDGLKTIEKNTFVVYGLGRRSERDLSVCEGKYEACNVAHHRLWLTSITERLCRCPRRTQCPIVYSERDEANDTQWVSNRAQLKFCEGLDESFETCTDDEPALEIEHHTLTMEGDEGVRRRTSMFCQCPWPNLFVLDKTTAVMPGKQILLYMCKQLPQCTMNQTCGYIRADTYEVYYRCSCPKDHLCLYRQPKATVLVSQLPHFEGEAFEGVCSPP